MRILLACLLLSLIFVSGCYYDSRDYLYPSLSAACSDTVNVTYSGKIAPILSNSCTSCHGGSNPEGSILLETYNEVKVFVDNGKLQSSIEHTGTASPMPKGIRKLDDCKIAAFAKWIQQGAPNN